MASTQKSLLIRAKHGSEDAWRDLVDLYRPLILRWIQLHDIVQQDAEDLCQDILTTLVERLDEFEHNGAVGAFRCWLRMMVVNRARMFWRSREHRPVAGVSEFHHVLEELAEPASDQSKRWDREHDDYVIREILRRVSLEFEPRTMQAFEMLALQEKSAKEVSETLQMSVGAVYVARSRVMRRVREEAEGLVDPLD